MVKRFVCASFILAVVLTLLGASALAEDMGIVSRTVVLMDATGEVFMSTGGRAEFPARAGVTLRAGYSVRTGGDGEAHIMIDDDKLIKLAPNSCVIVSQAELKLVITVRAGELVFVVSKPQPEGAVEFQSGGVSMGIRGTSGYLKRIKDELLSAIECGLFTGEVSLRAGRILLLIEAMEVDSIPSLDPGALTPDNASPYALLSTLDELLGIDLPDDFMDDEDILLLSALWEEMLDIENRPDDEGARRYLSDADIVTLAIGAIDKLVYEDQPYYATEESIIEYIDLLLKPIAEEFGVVTEVNTREFNPPENGDVDTPNGVMGSYKFDITVTRNAATDVTRPDIISIVPDRYTLTPNQQQLATYKREVERLELDPLHESDAQDEDSIQTYIISCIMDTLNDDEVSVIINCEWTKPIPGDADDPEGTPGSYKYSVTLTRGADSVTTGNLTLVISPQEYDGPLNADIIAEALDNMESYLLEIGGIYAKNIGEAREYLGFIFVEILGNKVEWAIVGGDSFSPATDGTESKPDGAPGSYTFRLTLTKGRTSVTTDAYTLTVLPVSYSESQNITLLNSLIEIINGMTFEPVDYMDAPDWSSVEEYLESEILSKLESAVTLPTDDPVIVYAMYIDTTEPVTGDEDSPEGTPGEYAFEAYIYREAYMYSATSDELSLGLLSPYMGETNAEMLERYAGILTDASIPPIPQAQAESDAAIHSHISDAVYSLTASDGVTDSELTVNVTKVSMTAPVVGDVEEPSGINGAYAFTLELTRGSHSASVAENSLVITAKEYPGESNQKLADRLAGIISEAAPFYTSYAAAPSQSAARSQILTAAKAVADDYAELYSLSVDTSSGALAASPSANPSAPLGEYYYPPIDGNADTPDGFEGYYQCKIIVTVGTKTSTTSILLMYISAKPYDGLSNADYLAQIIASVKGYFDEMGAIEAIDIEDARGFVNGILSDLMGAYDDVGYSISSDSFTPPVDGTESAPGGVPGTYNFVLTLSKDWTDADSDTITLNIAATSYEELQNAALIDSLASYVNTITFTSFYASGAPEWETVRPYVEDEALTKLVGAGLISAKTDISLSSTMTGETTPSPGDADYPEGEPGSFSFTLRMWREPYEYVAVSGELSVTVIDFYYETPNYDILQNQLEVMSDYGFGPQYSPVNPTELQQLAQQHLNYNDGYDDELTTVTLVTHSYTAPVFPFDSDPGEVGVYEYYFKLTRSAHTGSTGLKSMTVTPDTLEMIDARILGLISTPPTWDVSMGSYDTEASASAIARNYASAIVGANYPGEYTVDITVDKYTQPETTDVTGLGYMPDPPIGEPGYLVYRLTVTYSFGQSTTGQISMYLPPINTMTSLDPPVPA